MENIEIILDVLKRYGQSYGHSCYLHGVGNKEGKLPEDYFLDKYSKELSEKLNKNSFISITKQDEKIDPLFIEQNRDIINLLCSRVYLHYEYFSTRTINCIKAVDLDFIGDLAALEKNEFLKFRNFGKESLKEIDCFFNSKGLHFGMDLSKYDYENEKQKAIIDNQNKAINEISFLKSLKINDEIEIIKSHIKKNSVGLGKIKSIRFDGDEVNNNEYRVRIEILLTNKQRLNFFYNRYIDGIVDVYKNSDIDFKFPNNN